MNLTQELERLAKLHAEGALTAEEFAQAKRRLLSAEQLSGVPFKGIRRQSRYELFGLPLWEIAMGPDWERGEMRGHARAIFAFGDIATGGLACGGWARGLVALGGLAVGLVAVGGAAVGGIAVGGGALGLLALGGGACGYYAFGGGAVGVHTISGLSQDPEAVELLERFCPWLLEILQR
jgi:hypothetical protein